MYRNFIGNKSTDINSSRLIRNLQYDQQYTKMFLNSGGGGGVKKGLLVKKMVYKKFLMLKNFLKKS